MDGRALIWLNGALNWFRPVDEVPGTGKWPAAWSRRKIRTRVRKAQRFFFASSADGSGDPKPENSENSGAFSLAAG
jgi:hypothetical protein